MSTTERPFAALIHWRGACAATKQRCTARQDKSPAYDVCKVALLPAIIRRNNMVVIDVQCAEARFCDPMIEGVNIIGQKGLCPIPNEGAVMGTQLSTGGKGRSEVSESFHHGPLINVSVPGISWAESSG